MPGNDSKHEVHHGLTGQKRLRLVIVGFFIAFSIITLRMAQLAFRDAEPILASHEVHEFRPARPAIDDRNGELLATDISMPSLYAEPRKIIDIDEAVELLTSILPELSPSELQRKLSSGKSFVWLKRGITPAQRDAIKKLGLPAVGFRSETKRVYPKGRLASHVLGFVDVDSKGIAGIEKYLDDKGALFTASLAEPTTQSTLPVHLSIDVRVQHVLADELTKAIAKFRAIAGIGIVLDAFSGEVIAAVSLPDFNPNNPKEAQETTRMNRFTGGVFELGSAVKTATFAMALDSGANFQSRYDARFPLPAGGSRINDYKATRRILTLPEVFTYSSNIGTAKMALEVGEEAHQSFLRKIGFFDQLTTEVPEAAKPQLPGKWSRVSTMTAAFGHGISIQPLQLAMAAAAFVNGGLLIEPTFLRRDATVDVLSKRVIKSETSDMMRQLFRLNVQEGTATRADMVGYRVGGKTGTADKVVNGRYSSEKRLNTFLGAFPMDDPKYVVLVSLDEPQATPETFGFATAGWNAVPTAGLIIQRIAPLLNIAPILTSKELSALANGPNPGTGAD